MMVMKEYDDSQFDFVIDKATMDVILTDNKDPWNPSDDVITRSNSILLNCQRVLKPNGLFVSISFDQPHFRKKLLLNENVKENWIGETVNEKCQVLNIDHGLGYFMFILRKK